ncbi:MAG: VanZ family protein [Clostridiales bacterium]|nr:VanZ family protein [Clostridiales bacterium]
MCLWCVKRGSGKREWREVVTRAILLSFFFTYITAIFFSTLLIRTPAAEPKAAWIPLWSWYEAIVNHRKSLFYEIVLNILLFVPVGVLIRLLWGIHWRHAFLIGLAFSCFIEWMQLNIHPDRILRRSALRFMSVRRTASHH